MTQGRKERRVVRKAKETEKPETEAVTVDDRPEPSVWQRGAIPAAIERQARFAEPPVLGFDGTTVRSPHTDEAGWTALLSTALGSRSSEWTLQAVNWLTNAALARGQRPGPELEAQTNAGLAFMADVAPENTVEAALALQMFATHTVAMEMLQKTRRTDDRQALIEYANISTKMTRTFTMQMETLAKIRRGGEQVVKYIHIHEGGQAVVAGTINQGGREVNGNAFRQPHGQTADAPLAALRSPDPAADGLPIACDAERALLPARGQEPGGSEG